MRKIISKMLSITFLMIISMFMLKGPSILAGPGGDNALEPPGEGSGQLQEIINTFETVYINEYSFLDNSFQVSQPQMFSVYISKPTQTHQFADESDYIFLHIGNNNPYFSEGLYRLNGYITYYEFINKTEGSWLVNYDGDLTFYSHDSINDFRSTKSYYLNDVTEDYDIYTSFSLFSISEAIYTNESIDGYFFGCFKSSYDQNDETLLFMDRVYSSSEGFGNYYVIDDINDINLTYSFLGIVRIEFLYLNSSQLYPETFNIPDLYFISF